MSSLKRLAVDGLGRLDRIVAENYLSRFGERGSLMTFLFHGAFENEEEIAQGYLDPQQTLTVADYREIFEYFLRHGYRFVSLRNLEGLSPSGKYVLVTFDDGYANNLRLLPLMHELEIPVHFFISTSHVKNQRSFWWDVVYRERKKGGASPSSIRQEQEHLKKLPEPEIRSYLVREFGKDCEQPWADVDRPLTPTELKSLSEDPWVDIGNHTADHAILTRISLSEVEKQVRVAQDDLEEILGVRPTTFAYPNGNYHRSMFPLLKAQGIRTAISCDSGKNHLPLAGDDLLRVGRFTYSGP